LIGLLRFSPPFIMSTDLSNSPVPLAEISQGPNAFEAFLDRNQKNLVVLALLLAIAAAGFVIYRGIEKSSEETAGAALNKAEDIASLQALVDQHANTAAAGSAMVLLGNKQWTEGQQDAAIATLQKFIAENRSHPALPSAQASLAAKLMAQGKTADATKLFDELAGNTSASFIAPFALISLGDIAKAGGDLPKAEASYTKVKTDFPDSNFAEAAGRRLAILKAKPPVEIEAPPVPETPPAGSDATSGVPGLTPIPGAPAIEFPAETLPSAVAPAPSPEIPVTPETAPAAPAETPATPEP
jgi:predicted negative regulator of RcsB-dependent stress response